MSTSLHRVLILDTSTDLLCCAVAQLDSCERATIESPEPSINCEGAIPKPTVSILSSRDHRCRRQSNVELVGSAQEALDEAQLSMGDIDSILVGRGPGSFTGVRIGIATAKGIACGSHKPLFGASTLDAFAWNAWLAGVRGNLAVIADAMRKEVYPGLYLLDETGAHRQFATETVEKLGTSINQLKNWQDNAAATGNRPSSDLQSTASEPKSNLQLTGDGLFKYRATFEEAGFTDYLPEELWQPSSEALLYAAVTGGVFAQALSGVAAQGTTSPDQHETSEAAPHDQHETSEAAPLSSYETSDTSCHRTPTKPGATLQSQPAASGDPALVLPIYTRLSDAEESERERLGMPEPPTAQLTGTADILANQHLQLRPMSINDVEQVAALEYESFTGKYSEPWTKDMFFEALSQPHTTWWIAHDAGNIIGFAGGMLAGERLEVLDVAVNASRRREGIATRLIERLAYDAQMLNAQLLSLEVYEHNNPAISLYTKLGFSEVRTRKDYYGRAKHALVMDASLPLVFPENTQQVAQQSHNTAAKDRLWNRPFASRSQETLQALEAAGKLVLAIESSCDETAVSILDEQGTVHSSIVATQIDFHARFGGVVPEIASRKHTEAIVGVFEEALIRAGESFGCDSLDLSDLSAIAVTSGPGLVGALVVGVAFAKGLCLATGLPLISVNHLEGHLYANLFETPDLTPPFVASLVSGGNTMLVHVRDWADYEILGTTIDDAVGEAFDKVSKALGLGYPGGPIISKLAAQGNPRAIAFPRAMMHSGDYRFSLSGLKTAVITYINQQQAAGRAINLSDLAASFEAAVIDVQVAKAKTAVIECGVREFCVGGGVAANPALRAALTQALEPLGVRVTVPPLSVCGDNAAMIGLVALRKLAEGDFAPLTLDANPNAQLGG